MTTLIMDQSAPSPQHAEFFRHIVENASEGVWFVDANGVIQYLNPHMAHILGAPVANVIGKSVYAFTFEDERAQIEAYFAHRPNQSHQRIELRLRRLDGSECWIAQSASTLVDAAGNFQGTVALVSDISQRKCEETQLVESERAYSRVFERSKAVKLMIDPASGAIIAANAAARQYYGYSKAEFEKLTISSINTLSPAEVKAKMDKAEREDESHFQFRHRLKNGEVRDVEVLVTPVLVNGRQLLYSIVYDIGRQKDAERRLKLLQFTVEQAQISAIWISEDGRIRDANLFAEQLFERTRDEIVGQHLWAFDPLISETSWPERWNSIKRQGASSYRTEIINGRGIHVPIEVHVSHLVFDDEEVLISYARVITEQVRAEGLHALQHDVLANLASGQGLTQTLHELSCRVEALASDAHCSILLLNGKQLYHGAGPSLPPDYIKAIDGIEIGPEVGCCGSAAYLDRAVICTDIATDPRWKRTRALATAAGFAACWSTPIHARDGRVLGTFALYYHEKRGPTEYEQRIVEAVTSLAGLAIEHHEVESRIHALAFYDSLTGLPNRTLLADRVELALARAAREGHSVALLFLDLDRFKTINDTLGHAIGDKLLRIVSKRLEGAVRECDTVCRQGGDEFVILLPDCNANGASVVAEKLIAAIGESVEIDKHRLSGSASIGISLYPDDAQDFTDLLKHADTAMYRAKEAGRNGYRFYRVSMNADSSETLALEHELRLALTQRELLLHYQPQISMVDGSIYGLEALLRWPNPQRGMISPARFIPLAEECGLIDAIGAWVLDEACRQMLSWQKMGVQIPRIAVNLSARHFRHEDVPALVANTLSQYGLPAGLLTLEITESLMLQDESTFNALSSLRQMGVTLAVDDFGTGYSSLGYLKRFPVSEIKLDQTFVRDLGEDDGDRALANAVIRIGQSLHMTVVAEGVETMQQLAFLREQGCDVAQGYLFARPMGAEEMVKWLASYQPQLPEAANAAPGQTRAA